MVSFEMELDTIPLYALFFSLTVADKDPLWIEHAGLNKGSLTKKANKAGMGVQSFAKKHESAPGKLGKQSRLAETLSKLRGKGAAK